MLFDFAYYYLHTFILPSAVGQVFTPHCHLLQSTTNETIRKDGNLIIFHVALVVTLA